MGIRRVVGACVIVLLSMANLVAAASDLADAAMKKDKAGVRALLQKKADVNAPQTDGATALQWAVHWDDVELTDLLIKAGADVKAATRTGGTALSLACINGNAVIIEKLLKAGADVNSALTQYGDTPLMMAARTGRSDAVKVLLDNGGNVNAKETWGGTTALMWAVSEGHPDVAQMLIAHGADVNVRSKVLPVVKGTGGADKGTVPQDFKAGDTPKAGLAGGLTALLMAARDGDMVEARILVDAKADLKSIAGDGKAALEMAIYNGHYELASFLVDKGADVNHQDAEGFTPLWWTVDRRNADISNTIPWIVTLDPLDLTKKLLAAGANPNLKVNATPRYRGSIAGETKLRYAGGPVLMRAAFAGDLTLVKLLMANHADPNLATGDNTTALMAASGYGVIDDFSYQRPETERLEVIKILLAAGADVNYANDEGITPLMSAAHHANTEIIQFLVDKGANLAAHDLGRGNAASTEPLMPIDYAIGVTTFQPNAIVNRPQAEALIRKLMQERGIKHTTSECTLRGFTCLDIDPKSATPTQIATLRKRQTGNQVQGITGGLGVAPAKDEKDK